jgi:hypothetical protein
MTSEGDDRKRELMTEEAVEVPPLWQDDGAMARSTMTPQTRMTLLKHKRELVKQARKIASKGGYAGFDDVRQQFAENDALTLRLWATASDRDEIDRLCNDIRLKAR